MRLISTIFGKPEIIEGKIQPLDENEVVEIRLIAYATKKGTGFGIELNCKEGRIYILDEEQTSGRSVAVAIK